MPYIGVSGELKTKPTQHSVKELRSIGIQPDVLVCRSDRPINNELKTKKIEDVFKYIINRYGYNYKLAVTQCNKNIDKMNCNIVYRKYK